ncbi:class A beta-lactamase [Dyella sp. C9]|uniref:class A beta-lactamase n=1 Tax=Dyella sp. C9 TaxID=2202154 RepID=UPI000DEFAFDC|nr:class A beta-lactamase [Dyella sp. C9]
MSRSPWFRPLLGSALALALLAPFLPASATDGAPAVADAAALQRVVDAYAARARPGTLGVAVLDLKTGATAGVNADKPFPMMSVFKAPVAAAVLSRVDAGTLSLDQRVTIHRSDVLSGSAVPSIGARFRGEQMSFTVEQLLKAAVSESDNTAVDALLKVVRPDEVTAFLHAHGIDGLRVDQDEAGVAQVMRGLGQGGSAPAHESEQAQDQRFARGYQAFLDDPRNRSTPDAAVMFLRKLGGGELLSPASTQHLLGLMAAQTIPNRLRAGLPQGVRFADKTGTSGAFNGRTAAYNDIGIATWPDGRVLIVAAFLLDSPATPQARDALFATFARDLAAAAHP